MNGKVTLAAGLAAVCIFAGGVGAAPEPEARLIMAPAVPAVRLLVNGTEKPLSDTPRLERGHTLLPLRSLGEALGAQVDYDATTGFVTVNRGGEEIVIKPGLDRVQPAFRPFTAREAAENQLNLESCITGGRTYIPIRPLVQLLGAQVDWDETGRTVSVRLPDAASIPFAWYEMTEAGPVFRAEDRKPQGNWHREGYLEYMDFAVIRSEADFLSQPPLQTFAPIAPPAADYAKHIGVWAYLGEANTGGYDIKIERIAKEGAAIRVQVRLISPEPDDMVTMAFSYPTDFVLVERSHLETGPHTFTFVDQNGNVLKTMEVNL